MEVRPGQKGHHHSGWGLSHPEGGPGCVEIECAERMVSRFERKVSDYRRLMYDGIISKVLWVAATEKLTKDLNSVILGRPGFFFDRYENFQTYSISGGKL